jgi:hypothetical protein
MDTIAARLRASSSSSSSSMDGTAGSSQPARFQVSWLLRLLAAVHSCTMMCVCM